MDIRLFSRHLFVGMLLLSHTFICAQSAQEDAQRSEEALDYFRKWLEEDVVYIISTDERSVFENLATPEEKEQFIEQFWLRRDNDPATAINQFKEEHYRRIAYANEHYHSGTDGWRTDRGMVYIRFGPPDSVEKQPEGGSYHRKIQEGRGITYTFPFEVWFYRDVDGVGTGIEIEFVDRSRTNEYRMAMDTDEKDALFYVPNAGLTLAEEMGIQSRLDRIRTRWLGNPEGGVRGIGNRGRALRYRDYPMQRLEQMYNLNRGPAVKYKDLERLVTTRVSYSELPVQVRSDVLRLSDELAVTPVTIFIQNRELSFSPHPNNVDLMVASVALYGRVENLTGEVTYTFEEDIQRQISKLELQDSLTGVSVFQKPFPLQPGRYKLALVIRDQKSGKTTLSESLLAVPKPVEEGRLESSSVILTSEVKPVSDESSIGAPFVLGRFRVVPAVDNRFRPGDGYAQAYFEVYNMDLDQTTMEPAVLVEIALTREGEQVFPFQRIEHEFEFDTDRVVVYKTIPFQGLSAASYTLSFKVTDLIKNESLTKDIVFVIEEG